MATSYLAGYVVKRRGRPVVAESLDELLAEAIDLCWTQRPSRIRKQVREIDPP
jgi:hypothetical protein